MHQPSVLRRALKFLRYDLCHGFAFERRCHRMHHGSDPYCGLNLLRRHAGMTQNFFM